jgi:mannose-6-phosphate isomerase-like protein (cupin superfamily)
MKAVKVVQEIGSDLLEKIFNHGDVKCASILEVRAIIHQIETVWTRLTIAGLEVMKMRTICMADYVEGADGNLLGVKTVAFNFEKKRRVAATFWVITVGTGTVEMNYPNAGMNVDVDVYYGDVDCDGVWDCFEEVKRGV